MNARLLVVEIFLFPINYSIKLSAYVVALVSCTKHLICFDLFNNGCGC